MKSINNLVNKYNELLQEGDLQIAYRAILNFINRLRLKIINEYPDYVVGSTYQGQMDITFFSVNSELLQENGLKILVLYKYDENTFNLWLSGRNRRIAKNLEFNFKSLYENTNINIDENNKDSILEYCIIKTPDFDHQDEMMSLILSRLTEFDSLIEKQLELKDGDKIE